MKKLYNEILGLASRHDYFYHLNSNTSLSCHLNVAKMLGCLEIVRSGIILLPGNSILHRSRALPKFESVLIMQI